MGEVTEGLARLREGLAQLSRMGMPVWLAHAKTALAEACLVAGHYDEGLEQASQALSNTSEIGVRVDLPRLQLLRGGSCCSMFPDGNPRLQRAVSGPHSRSLVHKQRAVGL